MQTLAEAQQRILDAITPPHGETIPISAAAGRILADPVVAAIDLPSFNNSAMDGYAVRASDVANATAEAPVALRLLDRVVAGEESRTEVRAGGCVRVFTGSPLPSGADAVLMQEDTRTLPQDPDQVLMLDQVISGENVRLRGEDVAQGTQVLGQGHRVWAGSLALLASLGIATVRVGQRPVIGLLATGTELQNPGEPLVRGHIYESNRLSLAALLEKAGARTQLLPLVVDQLADIRSRLTEAFATCDCVVSSGGISVGELDLVKAAFTELGGQIEFWRVAIKPGKPFLFGRWKNKLFFGLPGNPVSAFVTGALLVRPAVMRWQGAANCELEKQKAILSQALRNDGDRTHFLRVTIDSGGQVGLAGKQASHFLSSLAAANGLLEVGPGCSYRVGEWVNVMRLG